MLDRIGELISAYSPVDVASLPGSVMAVVAAVLALAYVLGSLRRRPDGTSGPLVRMAIVLTVGVAGWWLLDELARREVAAERRALDARAFELTAQAIRPGSPLACLDAVAGDTVGQACESALFASPQTAAAAVNYVAAQLALLVSGSEQMRRGPPSAALMNLRRAIEADPFGVVAHVLETRDGCTPDQCDAFSLLQDASRISANLSARPFEARLRSLMTGWPAAGARPPNAPPAEVAAAPVAAAKVRNNLYFPSSDSIPPVSIMTAEPPSKQPPAPHDTTGAAETATPLPPRRPPPTAQARQPQGADSAPARPPLTPPAPPAPPAQ